MDISLLNKYKELEYKSIHENGTLFEVNFLVSRTHNVCPFCYCKLYEMRNKPLLYCRSKKHKNKFIIRKLSTPPLL